MPAPTGIATGLKAVLDPVEAGVPANKAQLMLRTGVDLLLQVLNLALQRIQVTRHLRTEGIELLHRSTTG